MIGPQWLRREAQDIRDASDPRPPDPDLLDQAAKDFDAVLRENAKFRKTLEWYGNKATYSYEDFESIPGSYIAPGVFEHDDGRLARVTLGLEKIDS